MTSFLLCNQLHLSLDRLPTMHYQLGLFIFIIKSRVCLDALRWLTNIYILEEECSLTASDEVIWREKDRKTMEGGVEMRSSCWETGVWIVLGVMMRKCLCRFDELGELVSDLVSVVLSAIRFSRVMVLRSSPSSSVAAARYSPRSSMAARHDR